MLYILPKVIAPVHHLNLTNLHSTEEHGKN